MRASRRRNPSLAPTMFLALLCLAPAAAATTTTTATAAPLPDPNCGFVVAALQGVRRSEISGKTVVSGEVVLLNRGASTDRKAYSVFVDLDGATLDYPPIGVKACGDVVVPNGGGRATCSFSITAQGKYEIATARAYGLAPGKAKTACVARALIA